MYQKRGFLSRKGKGRREFTAAVGEALAASMVAVVMAVAQQQQDDDESRPRAIVTAKQVFQTHAKASHRTEMPM